MSAPTEDAPPTGGTERCGNFRECGKTVAGGPGTGLCAACRGVAYCSRACQAANWPVHKAVCKTVIQREKAQLSALPRVFGAVPQFTTVMTAARAGVAAAQFNVGLLYASGNGVAQGWIMRMRSSG